MYTENRFVRLIEISINQINSNSYVEKWTSIGVSEHVILCYPALRGIRSDYWKNLTISAASRIILPISAYMPSAFSNARGFLNSGGFG